MTTPAEQFAILNTPEWLDALRVKVGEVFDALAAQQAHVSSLSFEIDGVPVKVTLDDSDPLDARAQIGTKDGGGWQYNIVAPIGWFRPSV